MAESKSRITVLLRSEETAGVLALVETCTPAGFERYFARTAAEAAGEAPPAWALEPVAETTVVGPQIRLAPDAKKPPAL